MSANTMEARPAVPQQTCMRGEVNAELRYVEVSCAAQQRLCTDCLMSSAFGHYLNILKLE